ncbi:hypothetical protein [Mesorhizobium sp. M0767]|uniref:hypothetical protein n=1 Tax=Mesorhizobium sp. M0767 TaxID=2956995 RepID=UPI0033363DB5
MNALSSRIDPTQLHMVSRDKVAYLVHEMMFPVNKEKGELLTAATAVLFAIMSERAAMDAHDLYLLGRRILTAPSPHHFKPNVQLEALRDFAGLRANSNPAI